MFVTYLLSKVRAFILYRETVRELSQLTDRELDDLGITRFEIENVAREHAHAYFGRHAALQRRTRPRLAGVLRSGVDPAPPAPYSMPMTFDPIHVVGGGLAGS